ncbi:MAG: hypothetical protein U0R49_11705 [Fimbriimonadales bacterium]
MAEKKEQSRIAPKFARASEVLEGLGFAPIDRIVTSKDIVLDSEHFALQTAPGDSKFREWQLPVLVHAAAELCLRVIPAECVFVEASHHADVLLLIAAGSLELDGQELQAGDWIYIPRTDSVKVKTGIEGGTVVRVCCFQANCYYRPQT